MPRSMSVEVIATRILFIRGQRVMLDKDLAELYGVSVGRLNEQVKRNLRRFPQDFMFQLTRQEVIDLKSQIVISRSQLFISQKDINLKSQIAISSSESIDTQEVINSNAVHRKPNYGGNRSLSYAFTEQGVAMLSSVLHSERAIRVNIMIMRAFIKLKELLLTHKDLADKIAELEKKYADHDDKIQLIFEAIKKLLEPQHEPLPPPKPPIGFRKD